MSLRRVAIVQETLPQYRSRFFERLRRNLRDEDVALRLIYGDPGGEQALRGDTLDLPWGHKINNVSLRLGEKRATWQPALRLIRDADLVIVEQARRHLLNYWLLFFRRTAKVALWGHGANLHEGRIERDRAVVARRADWWFAYTSISAEIVRGFGFPDDRITVVQNTVDVEEIEEQRASISFERLDEVRSELGISSPQVAIFVGALAQHKKIGFLLEAADVARELDGRFELIMAGDGPLRSSVEERASSRRWLHYLGPRFGRSKIELFAISKVQAMPGAVGLGLIDGFITEIPTVTTEIAGHGPEIAYLVPDDNGVLLSGSPDARTYGQALVGLMDDDRTLGRLREGCRRSAERLTMGNMVDRFTSGIVRALELSKN